MNPDFVQVTGYRLEYPDLTLSFKNENARKYNVILYSRLASELCRGFKSKNVRVTKSGTNVAFTKLLDGNEYDLEMKKIREILRKARENED